MDSKSASLADSARRRRRVLQPLAVIVAGITSAAALFASPALADNEAERKKQAAQDKKKVDASIAELSEGLAGTSKELQAAYTKLEQVKSQLPGAREELAAAEDKASAAAAQDTHLASRLAAAADKEQHQQNLIGDTQNNIADSESAVGRLAASAYRSGTTDKTLALVMSGDDLGDITDRYLLAGVALEAQGASVSRLQQERSKMEIAHQRLEAVRAEAAELKKQASEVLAKAEAAQKEAEEKEAAVAALVAEQEKATSAIRARKSEEEGQLVAMRKQSSALETELTRIAEQERRRAAEQAKAANPAPKAGGNSGGSKAPKSGGKKSGKLLRPVPGRLTSPYGYRIHPIYKTKRMHTGQDFGGACGTPIKAAESGTVLKATRAGGYGKQVVINHGVVGGKPMATSYSHLSRYAVTSGKKVSRGQVIGYVGTTGASTGCHLHFEVFLNGKRTNPARYL